MKAIKLSEDVVPIGEFKAQAAQWLERIRKTGDTIIITQNGKPAGVLLSPLEFDKIRERERLSESVTKGFLDAEAGRVMSSKELKKRLSENRSK